MRPRPGHFFMPLICVSSFRLVLVKGSGDQMDQTIIGTLETHGLLVRTITIVLFGMAGFLLLLTACGGFDSAPAVLHPWPRNINPFTILNAACAVRCELIAAVAEARFKHGWV